VRILVVDDDPGLAFLMSAALKRDGYDATGVTTLQEAKTASGPWDAIVADVHLPNGDGRELQMLYPEVPMVIISGLPSERPTLVKPFSMVQLRAAVRDAMEQP
jgi:DNA-binding response OmpR family regulator